MKRTVIPALFLLIVSVPALAGPNPAPTQADLDAMRNAIFASSGGPIDFDFGANGACTVSNDCGASPTISCSSSSGNCHSGFDWVECDGVRTYCAPPPTTCTISTSCPNGGSVSCTGTASYGCYRRIGCWVECSTGIFRCPGTNCPL